MAWIFKALLIIYIISAFATVAAIALTLHHRIKQRRHRREADHRIEEQAKAAGVWDKEPLVLGGRALEIKAWRHYKIKREPGEPDAHMRRRCMTVADNELASSQQRRKR